MTFKSCRRDLRFGVAALCGLAGIGLAGCSTSGSNTYTPPTAVQQQSIAAARNKAVMDNPNIPAAQKQWMVNNYGKPPAGMGGGAATQSGPPAGVPIPRGASKPPGN